ncbi:MAG: 16S rRNA (guanine(527)-N(7))-methyltransferase RsmG [Clostridia bacterium]
MNLIEKAKLYGIEISVKQNEQFETYSKLLVEWNEKINLTAITEENDIIDKHFIDSLLFLKSVDINDVKTLIDVGTGAGFPALPLKIMYPHLEVTLLDGLNKRLKFLQIVADELGLDVSCVHARAEEGGKNPELREKYDIATARAVANMNTLSEYCMPFVKKAGKFVALKGPGLEQEVKKADKAIEILGGQIEKIDHYILPDKDKSERNIAVISKVKNTPLKYPRHGSQIKKSSL